MKVYSGVTEIEMKVNGEKIRVSVKPTDILLDVLREKLGLTGAKPGCRNGDCGTCTVMVDGWPVKACLMLAVEAEGREITTVEGLRDAPIQKAFVDENAFQCGYCTSGFLMAAQALILQHPDADGDTMRAWLASNICRCTSYGEIERAVKSCLNR